jgi:hypothetical protein
MNEQEIEAIIKAAQAFNSELTRVAREVGKELHKAAAILGNAFACILPKDQNPFGWDQSWERVVKKLVRRERYLRRYRQRGMRMKKRKT